MNCSLHTAIFFLALVLRHYSRKFRRKANIIDRFMRDFLQMDAEQDVGISVIGATRRASNWSDRLVLSTGVSCIVASLLWHTVQPENLEASTMPPLMAEWFIPGLVGRKMSSFVGIVVPSIGMLVSSVILVLVTYFFPQDHQHTNNNENAAPTSSQTIHETTETLEQKTKSDTKPPHRRRKSIH